ncbi:17-beta-hydroxysteroid dehydrogenase type 2 isoform X2 [Centroberyx gerrardi]
MGNSDSGFCISTFCAIATAAYVYTVVRQVTEGCYAGCWAIALGTLGCPLYFWGCPGCCGLLLCCSLCLHYVTVGRRVEWLSMHGRAVLVTGCDSGFGHALAKLLSELGVTVFAGVLDASGPGAQRLKQHGSKHLQVLQLDVTDHSQIEQAHRYICAQVGEAGLWGLVNNAGILGYTADGEIQPITAYRRCMDVNFLSAVKMCQVFLPLLRSSRGRIVNISSMAGIFRSSEAGSRYQDELLNGLSSDTREDYGEAYISSVLDSPSKMADQLSDDLSPVVEDMRHALLSVHPKPLYSPGQTAWLFPFLYRLCPTAMSDFIIPRIFKFNDCHPAGLRMN